MCDETSLVKPDDYIVTDFFDKAYRSISMIGMVMIVGLMMMQVMTTILVTFFFGKPCLPVIKLSLTSVIFVVIMWMIMMKMVMMIVIMM